MYHKHKQNLLCHYCGYKAKLDRACNKEGTCDFVFSGPGVERILEEVKKKFPTKTSIIFSSDTMNKKDSSKNLEKIKMFDFQKIEFSLRINEKCSCWKNIFFEKISTIFFALLTKIKITRAVRSTII